MKFIISHDDKWLTENIVKHYISFLKKILYSEEMFKKCRNPNEVEVSTDNLFYIINLLKDLFLCVKKISNLGRYYTHK